MRRGTIEITDSSGDRAVINLSTTLTVRAVVGEINSRTDISVSARIEADHLVIEDGAGGSINVRDLAGGHAAEDLGTARDGDGQIFGSRIIYMTNDTQLSLLNDWNGVGVGVLNQDIELAVGGITLVAGLRNQLTHHPHFDRLNNGKGVR